MSRPPRPGTTENRRRFDEANTEFRGDERRAVVLVAASAQAQNLNVVSWGGAYTASQQQAYHDPYMAANPGVKIVNHDLGGGGVGETGGPRSNPAR